MDSKQSPLIAFQFAETTGLWGLIHSIKNALITARQQTYAFVLIDIHEIQGISCPSLGERYTLMREFYELVGHDLTVACVIPSDWFDPDQYAHKLAGQWGCISKFLSIRMRQSNGSKPSRSL